MGVRAKSGELMIADAETNEIMKRKNEVEAERAVVQQQQQQHVFKSSSFVAMPSAVECSIGLAA